jgi:pyridoxamine 5'-phosphate oxidase
MIRFLNNSIEIPYIKFREFYQLAESTKQDAIQAICISSFSKTSNEVDSRFVNLKFVDDNKFIFFSNYASPKGIQFDEHNQISAVIYWNAINIQIRMHAYIEKLDPEESDKYFAKRMKEKNALSISSRQSSKIESFDDVIKKYKETLHNKDLSLRPNYWGGYSFTPYSFEFWRGDSYRLNKRELHTLKNRDWKTYLLEP